MLKEIMEQPESIFNTMRGRINFDTDFVSLGGIKGESLNMQIPICNLGR